MELSDTIMLSLASFWVAVLTGYLIGVNYKHYTDTKNWLETHNIDSSFYTNNIKRRKDESFKNYIDYYIGCLGRTIAFKKIKK